MQGYVHNVYRSHAHTILAVVIVPLISTRYRAWRGRFERHKKIARWTGDMDHFSKLKYFVQTCRVPGRLGWGNPIAEA
jgi:uncharacterized membrane protein YozB (DUF420 family)